MLLLKGWAGLAPAFSLLLIFVGWKGLGGIYRVISLETKGGATLLSATFRAI